MIQAPTLEDMERYTNKHGPKKLGKLFSVLGKDIQFIKAWESPAGKEIMGHLINLTEESLEKIINEQADEKTRAEYRVCKDLLKYFEDRINTYEKNTNQLKRG